MPKPIDEYNVIRFADALTAIDTAARIRHFVSAPDKLSYFTDPTRAVLWANMPTDPEALLFISDGALKAAGEAGIAMDVQKRIPRSELPPMRTLLLGDRACEWGEGG
jgi:hypothetical protein